MTAATASKFEATVVFIVAALLVVIGHWRNAAWTDEVGVWRAARDNSPGKLRPYNNLGIALWNEAGLPWEAIAEHRAAAALEPRAVSPKVNLAVAYIMLGMHDEAEGELLAAIRLRPGRHDLHGNLGAVYLRKGQWARAREEFETALALKPDYEMARKNLEWLAGRGPGG